jgi:tetratricopeptide (TPR) repeat protein
VKAALLALILAAAPCFAQAPPKPRTATEAYEQANRYFQERKFQDCLNSLDDALRIDPKLVAALTLRARLAMAINRYDVAKDSLERAIAAAPDAWYPRFLYGFHYYQQNEMPSAIAAFTKARELNPRDPQTALYLGLADESLGRTSEALGLYRDAIRLEEAAGASHVETLLSAERLLLLLGRFEECDPLISRAAAIDPSSRDPHFEAARLRLKMGEYTQSIAEGEAALKLRNGDITDRQVHYLLVQAYKAAGNDSAAASHAASLRLLDK